MSVGPEHVALLERRLAAADAELAALRQRAEAAERERDALWEGSRKWEALVKAKEADLSAERDLKRAAYAELDETDAKLEAVLKVVEETIIPALEATERRLEECAHSLPGGSSPERVLQIAGAVPVDSAILRSLLAALSAARKTLED
jgi:chromosome segregation ATPase